jgi:histidyl-tRNA synthetase
VGLGPESVQILLNDRRLAERLLQAQGIAPGLRASVFRLIDRRDKLSPQAWAAQARELGLDERQLDGLRAILADRSAWRDSADLIAVFEAAEALGAREYLAYDPSVIRGLDYYTGTVFEARDTAGEHRAFLGGGRYDNLVGEVGGESLPSVGFAMGDVVLSLALQEAGRLPASPLTAEVLVTQFDGASVLATLSLAAGLRRAGLRTEWYPEATRLPKQLKYADRQGIPCAVILGPDEVAAAEVTIKDLRSGRQSRVPLDQAAAFLLGLLRATP